MHNVRHINRCNCYQNTIYYREFAIGFGFLSNCTLMLTFCQFQSIENVFDPCALSSFRLQQLGFIQSIIICKCMVAYSTLELLMSRCRITRQSAPTVLHSISIWRFVNDHLPDHGSATYRQQTTACNKGYNCWGYIDGSVQDIRYSIANALESRPSCTSASIYFDQNIPWHYGLAINN